MSAAATADAPVFTRVGAYPLYALSSSAQAAAPGYWAGFRAGDATDAAQLSLDQAWQDQDGIYLFCGTDPTGDPAAFLAGLAELFGPGQRFGWIDDPNAAMADWIVSRLAARPEGASDGGGDGSGDGTAWRVSVQARFAVGGYAVEIDAGTRLAQADSGVAIDVSAGGGLFLAAPGDAYEALPGTGLLPFTGAALGAWTAVFDFLHVGVDGEPDDLTRLGVQLRYAVPDPEQADIGAVLPIPLPILSQDGHTLTGRLAFDPIHRTSPDRTALSIAPDAATNPAQSALLAAGPPLGTSLRTALGHRVLLSPATATAPLRSARFVFCYSPLYTGGDPAYRDYYLAPDGAFGLSFAPQPGENPDRRLLLGLSGGEYVQMPDRAIVQFDAGRAAYAPATDLAPDAPETATTSALAADDLLTSAATTAYLSVLPPEVGPLGLVYYAQPQQSPWYTAAADGSDGYLESRPLPAAWLPALDPTPEPPAALPIAGYAGIGAGLAQAARLLEATALAPARRAAIGDPPAASTTPAAASQEDATLRVVTPQGLVADVAAGEDPLTAQWRRLVIASFPGAQVPELVFTEVGAPLRAALQTGELFLVVADVDEFMRHSSVPYALDSAAYDVLLSEGVPAPVVDELRLAVNAVYPTESAFLAALPPSAAPYAAAVLAVAGQLKAVIEDWTFQLSPRSWRTEPGSATVMLIKFAGRALGALAEEPGAWGWPSAAGDAAATRNMLHAIFTAAAEAPDGSAYQSFYRDVVADPAWNGVLFLNAPVSLAELPADLQFVTAGIDPARCYAHHVGFSLTPVHAADRAVTLGRTAAFGLLHYEDPADLVLAASVPFAFKTQQLSVRFAGGQIADLSAQVELMVNQLFGSPVAIGQPDHGNNLILAGAYQRQNGVPAYQFALTRECDFAPGGAALRGIEVSAVALQTSTGSVADGVSTVDFVLSGNLRFAELPYFDLFSYGPVAETPDGAEPVDGYLRYSGFVVRMTFPIASPGEQTFTVDESRIALDPGASLPRPNSLAAKFPLRVRSILAVPSPPAPPDGSPAADPPAGQRPADLGYASVLAPMDQSVLEPPWYGLVLRLDLGTLGALAGSAGVSVDLLAGWGIGEDQPVYLGLKLAGGPSDAGWPVQGVLRLGFRAFEFQVAEDVAEREYLLVLRHLALSVLGWSLPGGDLDVVLCGDPSADQAAALAWYGAYAAPGVGGGSGADSAGAGGVGVTRRLRSGRRSLPPGSGLRGSAGPGPISPGRTR